MGAGRKDRPHFARWGASAKGAVILQRWGQNAKVGSKRKDMGLYRKEKLMEVVKDRGYETQRAVADAIAPIFKVSRTTAMNKISNGKFTKEECEVIGSMFEMTMKEYYDVFMYGLFQEDREGHYRCHIEEPYLHLHPIPMNMSPLEHARAKWGEIVDEINEIEYDDE